MRHFSLLCESFLREVFHLLCNEGSIYNPLLTIYANIGQRSPIANKGPYFDSLRKEVSPDYKVQKHDEPICNMLTVRWLSMWALTLDDISSQFIHSNKRNYKKVKKKLSLTHSLNEYSYSTPLQ